MLYSGFNILPAGDFSADDVARQLLTELPQFTAYDTQHGLYNFGTATTAVTVSIESDGFLVCDNLVDRQLAREISDSLVAKIKELKIEIQDVSEI